MKRNSAFTMAEIFSSSFTDNRKNAFTLAEVLITLGIIGVVAAMTMPTLIAKQQEKEIVAKLKKFNSIIDQSFKLAIQEYGDIDTWGVGAGGTGTAETDEEKAQQHANQQVIMDRITKGLKVLSKCDYDQPCEQTLRYTRHSLDGTEYSSFVPRVILADGTAIIGTTHISPKCTGKAGTTKMLQNVCGEVFVDTNGPKPPNTTGKDVFLFYITKYGIVPQGNKGETGGMAHTFEKYCNLQTTNNINGYGCTAWVMENENQDYLRCNDLSWDGKRKCK